MLSNRMADSKNDVLMKHSPLTTRKLNSNSHRHSHMGSDCGEGKLRWSVYDGVKIIAATPEALMAEIDSAISNLEYSRATSFLDSATTSSSSSTAANSDRYDARMADEAYKAGCAALAAGKLDEALRSLNLSLSKCPPDKTSAVAKLNSLISLTSQQLQRSAN